MRTEQETVNEYEVLVHLARAVPLSEEIVQIGASREVSNGWHDVSPGEVDGKVGLIHLGPGCHAELQHWMGHLVKGAIVLMEHYWPGSEAYVYAIDLAARGYITSLSEARNWRGLGVATFIGKDHS